LSEDLIKKIQSLVNDGKGDLGRLQHILNSLKQGKTLFSSDKQYLDSLLEKYPTKESQQPQTEEKPSEIQELRKKIQELEKKVEKKSESEKTVDIEDLRRRISYEKKQRELKQEVEYMKKDIGTITLVAVIGGLFGINGLGHFMIGKKGTGVGYLVGGIIAMAFFGVVTMGYGAILPWIIFLIVSTLSARASTKVWNEYIELFVKEPTWKAIEEFIEEYSKPSPKSQPQSKPQTKQKTQRSRKDKVLIILGIILAGMVSLVLIDQYVYEIYFGDFGGFVEQNREPSKADLIRQHCLLANGVLYDRSSYFGKPNSPRCPYGTVADLNAELTWWNPFD